MINLSFSISAINSAIKSKKLEVNLKKDKLSLNLAKNLFELGYITGYSILDNSILIKLRMNKNRIVLRNIQLVSKSSNRVYIKKKNFFKFYSLASRGNLAIYLFSISEGKYSGIVSDVEALILNRGGELICTIN